MLSWTNEEQIIWCAYVLFDTIDCWNEVDDIRKFKPLKFSIRFNDNDFHGTALKEQKLNEKM